MLSRRIIIAILLGWILTGMISSLTTPDPDTVRTIYSSFQIDFIRPPTWLFAVAWSGIVIAWITIQILSVAKKPIGLWWVMWAGIMLNFAFFQAFTFGSGRPEMFAIFTFAMDALVIAQIRMSVQYNYLKKWQFALWVPCVLWLSLASILSLDILLG